jgi:hypothetical protein
VSEEHGWTEPPKCIVLLECVEKLERVADEVVEL